MTRLYLVDGKLTKGVWRAVILSQSRLGDAPLVEIVHEGAALPGTTVEAAEGGEGQQWLLRFAIPADRLSEGAQVFVVRDPARDEAIGQMTLTCGSPQESDLAAEIELLRDELDLLKRAFRRHCSETGG